MNSKIGVRLDRVLGATAASAVAATGAGLVGPTTSAEAAIIYSGIVNLNVPNTIDGLYVNLVTGATGAAGANVAGWDINPYRSATGPDTFNLFSNLTPATYLQLGTSTFLHSAGTLVNSAQVFANPNGGTDLTPQVKFNDENFFGVQFLNEATGATNYGWVRMTFGATLATRVITDYAYENTGAGIITAVPEPSTWCLLATGAVGLFAARRRRLAAAS